MPHRLTPFAAAALALTSAACASSAPARPGASRAPSSDWTPESRAAMTELDSKDFALAVAPAPAQTTAFAAAYASLPMLPDDPQAPEVVATAPRSAEITSETDRIGSYDQPEWTAHRRFARTRVYVLPEGQWELEQWWRGTFDQGERTSHRFQTEVGVGLPNRFQFDLYGNVDQEDGVTTWTGLQPELRWAPADWGDIPLNPTLYLEYKWNHDENDVFESKILLGEEITPLWHWGMNLSVEQQLGADREQELAITQAVSYTLLDRQLSVGVEFEYDRVTSKTSRDEPEHEFYAGPSIQWRPNECTHIDLVPLFGWHDAHDMRIYLVFGWDFGGGPSSEGHRAPVSSKSR